MNSVFVVKIIYCAASIQGIFLGFLIFRSRLNQPANKILSILLFLISFHLVLVGFDEREFFITFPHLSRISWIIGSLYWPLLFLFVQFITGTQPDKIWKSFWTLIPFIIFLSIMLPYYLQSASEKRALLTNFEEASRADFGWINQTISVLHILFMIFFLLYYQRFEKRLLDEYSEIESMRIKWLKQFLIFTLTVTILAVFSFFVRTWEIPLLSRLYSFHFIGIVFLFYWLSFKALTQPVVFGITASSVPDTDKVTNKQKDESQEYEKYQKSGLEIDVARDLFNHVRSVLEDQKLYLKPDLTLAELAAASQIPKHQLSQVINTCYTGNFFDLINDFRLQAFIQLAVRGEKKHLSLVGIALEAGFNSKATFYSVFRKKTGMTPSAYLERQSKEG